VNTSPPPSFRAYVAGFATILLWAGSFPAIAVAVRHVDPVGLAAARFAVAAIAGSLWLASRTGDLPSRSDLGRIVASSLLGIALYNVLINSGQRTVSPGAASFIVATQTIFAAGLSHLLGQEKVGLGAIAGTVLSLIGVGLISLGQAPEVRFGAGTPVVLAAAVCSGVSFVLQRPLAVKYGGLRCACWTLVVGALLLSPRLPDGLEQTARSPEAIAAVAFLALGSGVLGYACWFTALAGLGAARAANLLFLMAPVAVALAIPIGGHMPELFTIVGGAAALAGVAVVNRSHRRASASNQEL
jgi:drug/metabolite transporter (DMT)-like permease